MDISFEVMLGRKERAYTKAIQTKQNVPQTKKTLLWRFAPSSSTMYGVE